MNRMLEQEAESDDNSNGQSPNANHKYEKLDTDVKNNSKDQENSTDDISKNAKTVSNNAQNDSAATLEQENVKENNTNNQETQHNFESPLETDEFHLSQPQFTKTGSLSFTILAQMSGSSLLSCSYIIYQIGWVLSVIAFVIVGVSVYIFFKYFLDTAHYTQSQSYKEMCEKVLNKKIANILEFCIIFSYVGFVTSSITIGADAIQSFIVYVCNYEISMVVLKIGISVLLIFPLCLLKRIEQLEKLGLVSGIVIIITVFTVVFYFFANISSGVLCTTEDGQSIRYQLLAFPQQSGLTTALNFFMYIPVMLSNFAAHTIIPAIMYELHGPPLLRKRVTKYGLYSSLIIGYILYALIGFLGAWQFGTFINDNILDAYGWCNQLWPQIVFLLFGFIVIITYPLVLYPIKVSIIKSCGKDVQTRQGYLIAIIISVAFVIATCLLACFLDNILDIFGLFEDLTGFMFYFTVPIAFIVYFPKTKKQNKQLDAIIATNVFVDPIIVGFSAFLGAGASKQQVDEVRQVSEKLFGREESFAGTDNRTPGVFRTRSLSTNNLQKLEKIVQLKKDPNALDDSDLDLDRGHDYGKLDKESFNSSDAPDDDLLDIGKPLVTNKIAKLKKEKQKNKDITKTQQANNQQKQKEQKLQLTQFVGRVSSLRKIIGLVAVALAFALCAEGTVMNAINVIQDIIN